MVPTIPIGMYQTFSTFLGPQLLLMVYYCISNVYFMYYNILYSWGWARKWYQRDYIVR